GDNAGNYLLDCDGNVVRVCWVNVNLPVSPLPPFWHNAACTGSYMDVDTYCFDTSAHILTVTKRCHRLDLLGRPVGNYFGTCDCAGNSGVVLFSGAPPSDYRVLEQALGSYDGNPR